MKRTMLAAVMGGVMALIASAFTAQAAPVSAIQVGKSAQSGEALVQKTEWRHRHHHYRRHHYRPYYWHTPRRHYYHHHTYRPHYWHHRRHHHHHHTYRHHRRHYH
jgi:Ni/Co efflux regulator RcnB